MLQPAEGSRRPGTLCGVRAVPSAKKKTLRNLTFVGNSASSRFGFCGPRGTHSGRRSSWTTRKLQARRHDVLAAMEGRPGQVWKSRVADEFDALTLVIWAGSRGWTTATPDDVFDFLGYLDTQEKRTNMVQATFSRALEVQAMTRVWTGLHAEDGTRLSQPGKRLSVELKMAMKEHENGER